MKLSEYKGFLPYLLFPALLVILFYLLPMDLQSQFAFTPSSPVWYTRFTASFFHNNAEHLASNVWATVAILLVLWLLARKAKQTDDLWKLFLAIILITPLVSSTFTQIFLPTMPSGRGASDIVFALLGLIPAYLFLFVEVREWAYYAPSALLAVLLTAAALQGQTGVAIILASLQYALFFYLFQRKGGNLLSTDGALMLIALSLLPLVILSGFPVNIVYNGSLVGVFQHYVGITLGLLGGATYLFWVCRWQKQSRKRK